MLSQSVGVLEHDWLLRSEVVPIRGIEFELAFSCARQITIGRATIFGYRLAL